VRAATFHLVAVLEWLSGTAALAQNGAVSEVWPALHVFWRPAEHQRTYLDLSLSTERESQKREGTVGLYQDYLRLPRAFARVGYSFVFSTRDASHRESRVVGELNVGGQVANAVRIVNRVRGDLRWVNNVYSYRVRDRIHVQRHGKSGLPAFAPYGTVEGYYDSRYNTIARVAGRLGGEWRLHKPASLDVYVARQNNSRSAPRYVNALGITVILNY
jgi:uncharacterized protein DUF2490